MTLTLAWLVVAALMAAPPAFFGCCCNNPCANLCATVRKCGPAFVSGASVAVTVHGTGAAVGSGTTNGSGQFCVMVPNGTYDVAVAWGVYSVTQTVTISGCVGRTLTFDFVDTLGLVITGDGCGPAGGTASVTFTNGGGTVGTASCTVPCTATATVTNPVSGAVTATVTWKSRTYTVTFTPTVSNCSAGLTVYEHICVLVWGCNDLPLPGASVTFDVAAVGTVGTATTDSNGVACVDSSTGLKSGDAVTATVTKAPRFASGSCSYTIPPGTSFGSGCTAAGCKVTLSPATGYQCACCVDPIKEVLGTNDGFGDITMTWDGTFWKGCAMRTASTSANPGFPCGGSGFSSGSLVPVWFYMATNCGFGISLQHCKPGGVGGGVGDYPINGNVCADGPLGDGVYFNNTFGGSFTCPPSFAKTWTHTIPDLFSGGAFDPLCRIYGTGGVTVSGVITES